MMPPPNPPVTFNNATWIASFPDFTNVGATLGQSYFNRATYICANSPSNPMNRTPGMLADALYLLTSHIAWLNAPRDASGNPAATGAPASPIVGRIDQATEGSVSVHADMGEANAGSPSQAYFMQSKWGSEYWTMTAGFRTAVPVSMPTFVGFPPYIGRGFGFGRGCRGCV